MARHEGEHRVQQRANVDRGDWGTASVSAEIPAVAADFLRQQRMIFIGAVDAEGAVWATMLAGPPGFAEPLDQRTIVVNDLPGPEDPLRDVVARDTEVGMLAMEPRTRRRMRVNGRSHHDDGRLVVHTGQVYANCPKYIQSRDLQPDDGTETPSPARTTAELTVEQQRWISGADTFVVATHAPGHGADVSHRGGNTGFIDVRSPQHLVWPDYAGNEMYMTLGNLELTPACGLLFVDWDHGHSLQLTGQARTDWDADHAASVPGAQRLVEYQVDQVVQIDHASPLRWRFADYSRHNPPVAARADQVAARGAVSGQGAK
jgi:predicted pyridoxine 5'-phosphate oxidase superfamily flavin-nucleotide-binding protein